VEQQRIDKGQKFSSTRRARSDKGGFVRLRLTIGPTIRPRPKKVSSVANVVPTLFGNSLAMMAKLDVRKAAFPRASMMRMTKASVMNIVWPGTRSSRPKRIADVPVVKIPQLNRT
jgi:hypothetical protein